jgi:A/G-specific adenine glycosylase
MHAAAKQIVHERTGGLPESSQEWRKLPGIGRYTAAAIASIAFREPVAVVDGNVERVLRRLLHVSHGHSWSAAQELLDPLQPGDSNQAMMELGAMICLPGKPLCCQCPIMKFCGTRGRGETRNRKPKQVKASVSFVLATKGESVLLVRRGAGERLMSGMWELPPLKHPAHGRSLLFRLRHSITVTDYVVSVVAQPDLAAENAQWIRRGRLHRLPLTGLAKKILYRANIIE